VRYLGLLLLLLLLLVVRRLVSGLYGDRLTSAAATGRTSW